MTYNLRGKIANAHPYSLDKNLVVEGAAAEAKATGEAIAEAKKEANLHAENTSNPHKVTASQLGLGLVDNTSDIEKPVSTLQAKAIEDAKKAGTDAQATAENAQKAADDAQTAADNAQTAADNAQTYAQNATENALKDSKDYTDSKHIFYTATISAEWNGEAAPYTQEVTLEGILATDHPHVMPVYSDNVETALLEKEAWEMVSDGNAEDGKITFTCYEDKPTTAIPIQIEVNR